MDIPPKMRRSDAALATELNSGSLALLHTVSGKYFTTNDVGKLIWEQLAEPRTREELVARVASTYRIDQARAQGDVATFIDSLRSAALLEFTT